MRDDGEHGWLLEFVEPPEAAREQIACLLETLPAIERLDAEEPGGVVFARIATDRIEVGGLAD